jgi:hypothetical protein
VIVSASRRTDIPAFAMPWMERRLAAGWCRVVNPFNPAQQRLVSLAPGEVDALVFWTRAPGRLARRVPALSALGHDRIAAHVTITGYRRELEPNVPSTRRALDGARALAEALGSPRAVRWRYDPILLGGRDTAEDHRRRFEALARALEGFTREVVVSFVDLYRKTARRLAALEPGGYPVDPEAGARDEDRSLIRDLVAMAEAAGMRVTTCAEPRSFASEGAAPGRCIDPAWLGALFPGRDLPRRKDPGQRRDCGCAPSIDVGVPDTCLHGCAYCYAVNSQRAAVARFARHDPEGDALLPVPHRGRPSVVGRVPDEARRLAGLSGPAPADAEERAPGAPSSR